jgi:hypothetical protein
MLARARQTAEARVQRMAEASRALSGATLRNRRDMLPRW